MRVRSTVSVVRRLAIFSGTATNKRPFRTSLTGNSAGAISIRPSCQRTSRGIPGLSPASRRTSLGMTRRPAESMVVFMVRILPHSHAGLNETRQPIFNTPSPQPNNSRPQLPTALLESAQPSPSRIIFVELPNTVFWATTLGQVSDAGLESPACAQRHKILCLRILDRCKSLHYNCGCKYVNK